MEILLSEFYNADLHTRNYIERKLYIEAPRTHIHGITQVGKTYLLKRHLLGLKKSEYLYINLHDMRIDIAELEKNLPTFCTQNKIKYLALDNYQEDFKLPNLASIITTSECVSKDQSFKNYALYALDYEEFLAYEHKYDSSAINHFLLLGGLPKMHFLESENRLLYIQRALSVSLSDIELSILQLLAKLGSQKVSAFTLYERLKVERKISKDKLYSSLQSLLDKQYIYELQKYQHQRATKKIFLCDIAVRSALSSAKHFGRIFENLIYLEMRKRSFEVYYEEGIDFYVPFQQRVVLALPFFEHANLFKKMEKIEAFLITHDVKTVEIVTMGNEGELNHPYFHVEMIAFSQWAITQGE